MNNTHHNNKLYCIDCWFSLYTDIINLLKIAASFSSYCLILICLTVIIFL